MKTLCIKPRNIRKKWKKSGIYEPYQKIGRLTEEENKKEGGGMKNTLHESSGYSVGTQHTCSTQHTIQRRSTKPWTSAVWHNVQVAPLFAGHVTYVL